MKNFSKILCVVLALVVALSAASCAMAPQTAYEKDGIKLPIGVYIYYMYTAYTSAQGFAQKSDLYDASTGKYDGKKSFLKMEITDDDGNTAVAEDWIKNKADERTKEAVAIYTKFNELGCTIDQTELDNTRTYYKNYWDQSYATQLEPFGISFDSFFMAGYEIPVRETEAFKAEYATDGPSAVSNEELTKYFTENYVSYKYFSANLFTTAAADTADASAETASESVALPADEIDAYKKDFESYASTLSSGGSFDDVKTSYMEKYAVEQDPATQNVEIIPDDTEDEILKAIKGMKDGQAMTMEIGDDDTSKQLYVLYREPIENQTAKYTDPEQEKDTVLSSMKQEDFEQLLKDLVEKLNVTLSSACGSYNPSLFEKTTKTTK